MPIKRPSKTVRAKGSLGATGRPREHSRMTLRAVLCVAIRSGKAKAEELVAIERRCPPAHRRATVVSPVVPLAALFDPVRPVSRSGRRSPWVIPKASFVPVLHQLPKVSRHIVEAVWVGQLGGHGRSLAVLMPNSSASSSSHGTAAQLTATKGPLRRSDDRYRMRATYSLPTPV